MKSIPGELLPGLSSACFHKQNPSSETAGTFSKVLQISKENRVILGKPSAFKSSEKQCGLH